MNVTILTAGTKIAADKEKTFENNNYQADLKTIYYKLPFDTTLYNISADTNDNIYVRSALNINFNNKEQKLEDSQSITLNMILNIEGESSESSISIDGSSTTYIQFNYPLISAGTDNIDLGTYNEDTGKYEYLYKCYAYNYNPTNAIVPDLENSISISTENDLTIIRQEPNKTVNTITFKYPFDKKSEYEYIIPVQFKSADPTKSITLENATVLNPYKTIDGNNVSTDSTNVIKAYIDYCYYIIPNNSNSIIFSGLKLSTSDEIIIGKIEKRNGLNTKDINSPDPLYKIEAKFSQTETNLSEVEKIIKANNTFNWTYKVNDIDKVAQPLTAKAFWNTNHFANSYTLPKLSSIDITVNSSSLK